MPLSELYFALDPGAGDEIPYIDLIHRAIEGLVDSLQQPIEGEAQRAAVRQDVYADQGVATPFP